MDNVFDRETVTAPNQPHLVPCLLYTSDAADDP